MRSAWSWLTIVVERQLRTRLVELVAECSDVVVDLSFWSRQRREEYKALITAHGAAWQLVDLEVPRNELLRRLALRRLDPGRTRAGGTGIPGQIFWPVSKLPRMRVRPASARNGAALCGNSEPAGYGYWE